MTVIKISLTDSMGNNSDLHSGNFLFEPRVVHQRLQYFFSRFSIPPANTAVASQIGYQFLLSKFLPIVQFFDVKYTTCFDL